MKDRIVALDELRGIAVIMMIVYHFFYSMEFVVSINTYDILNNPYFIVFQITIGILFVFISGFSSNISDRNIEHGIKLIGVAALISMFTSIFLPREKIIFGVVHLLGTLIFFTGLIETVYNKNFLKKYTGAILCIIFILLFIACYNVPRGYINLGYSIFHLPGHWYSNNITSALGFPTESFFSADYYPIIPWGFVYFSGYFLSSSIKNLVAVSKYSILGNNSVLSNIGKKSLLIYIIHQPIIILMLVIYNIFIKFTWRQ